MFWLVTSDQSIQWCRYIDTHMTFNLVLITVMKYQY